MKKSTLAVSLLCILIIAACTKNEQGATTQPDKEVYLDLSDTAGNYFNNRHRTDIDKKVAVGRVLFYDNHLSLNNAVSCASCHKQQFAFADNAALSRGFEGRLTERNSPAIQNLILNGKLNLVNRPIGLVNFQSVPLFWDARETNLKEMVLRPVNNHVEMGIADMSTLPTKLQELPYYNGLVLDAYGTDVITTDIIAESLSWFLASIESRTSRFDQFNTGKSDAFTAQELHGRNLFITKYDCASCHSAIGQYSGQEGGSNIGLDVVAKDKGMGPIGTGADGEFKIPNLHNIAVTAPYMHDGRFKTLGEVIDHYSNNIQDNKGLDRRLKDLEGKPLRMSISESEKAALIAFMNTMTDYALLTNKVYSNPFKTK